MERRVSQASRAFGALRKAVFLDKDLTLNIKIKFYQVHVLLVLGAECWIPLRNHLKKVNTFHNRWIRIILEFQTRNNGS